MPIHQQQHFLLAYDIADPKRLVRVHRTVRRHGIPLQYSVFLVPATPVDIDALLSELSAIIEEAKDDIRVYPLPRHLEWVQFGRQTFPVGIEFFGEGFHGLISSSSKE